MADPSPGGSELGGTLKFTPLSSAAGAGFWAALAGRKLDTEGLSTARVPLVARVPPGQVRRVPAAACLGEALDRPARGGGEAGGRRLHWIQRLDRVRNALERPGDPRPLLPPSPPHGDRQAGA